MKQVLSEKSDQDAAMPYGLVACDAWISPLEGPFTSLAKLCVVNVLTAREVCRDIFNKDLLASHARPFHGRSLVSGAWMSGAAKQNTLAATIAVGALDGVCGRWASWLASDQHLRFCPTCLDHGFQSVLYQIDGMTRCPIHQQLLLDACPKCGAPTPPYALTPQSLDSPLHCPKCSEPYSAAWEPGNGFGQWHTPTGSEALEQLGRWLRKIDKTRIDWPELGTWSLSPSHSESDKRQAVFSALRLAFPDKDVTVEKSVPLLVMRRSCSNQHLPMFRKQGSCISSRTSVYKSIRRHIFRRLKHKPHQENGMRRRGLQHDWVTHSLVPDPTVHCRPELHALFLWRHRFEENFLNEELEHQHFPNASRRHASLELRSRVLGWPINWSVDEMTWGYFAILSFFEDLWTAQQWRELTEPLGDALGHHDVLDQRALERRAQYLDLYRVWVQRMSCDLDIWPSGITHFSYGKEMRLGQKLVVVAPLRHSASTNEVDWLGNEPNDLHPDEAIAPAPEVEVGIAPLERFVAPLEFDGRNGKFRCKEPTLLKAECDADAVRLWVAASETEQCAKGRRHTGEKVLNWACFKKRRALSSLDREDFAEFSRFLVAPEPAERWICPSGTRRTSSAWRPFHGPLGPASRRTCMAHIASLISWLQKELYANLLSVHSARSLDQGFANSAVSVQRGSTYQAEATVICFREWEWICQSLIADDTDKGVQRRLIVELLYYGGLRLEELIQLSMRQMIPPSPSCEDWQMLLPKRPVWQERVVRTAPPLTATLTRSLNGIKGFSEDDMVVMVNRGQITSAVRSAMRAAATLAANADDLVSASSLNKRSAISLRRAFAEHRRQLSQGAGRAAREPTLAETEHSKRCCARYLRVATSDLELMKQRGYLK